MSFEIVFNIAELGPAGWGLGVQAGLGGGGETFAKMLPTPHPHFCSYSEAFHYGHTYFYTF